MMPSSRGVVKAKRGFPESLRLECGHKPENMVTVIPEEKDQKCPNFVGLFRLEGTAANSRTPEFSQFQSKSRLGYFIFGRFWETFI
jgi:hypothetical protein